VRRRIFGGQKGGGIDKRTIYEAELTKEGRESAGPNHWQNKFHKRPTRLGTVTENKPRWPEKTARNRIAKRKKPG